MAVTNLPFLSQYAGIQGIIDFGRGLAANVVGQPGSIFRVTPTSTGNYVQTANQVYANFPALRRAVTGGPAFENHGLMDLVMFDVVCNLTDLQVGDVWVQTDPYYGVGADLVTYATNEFVGWVLVHHSVMNKAIAAQVQRYAMIYRAVSGVDSSGYATAFQQETMALQIVNGVATFSNNYSGSLIPIGMNPRTGGLKAPMRPTVHSLPEEPSYSVYVPPINGYAPVEGDIFQLGGGARYVVEASWHLDSGMVGNTAIVKKTNPQSQNMGEF